YNSSFQQFVSGTNNTLYVDTTSATHVFKADQATGRVFVELLGPRSSNGTVPFLGFEIVDVFSDPTPTDIDVELGTRIPAYEDRRDDSQLTVVPPQTQTAFYYEQPIAGASQFNLFATRETFNLNDFTAYWLVTSLAGLQWPYLYDRYHEYWPS